MLVSVLVEVNVSVPLVCVSVVTNTYVSASATRLTERLCRYFNLPGQLVLVYVSVVVRVIVDVGTGVSVPVGYVG